MKRYLSFLMVIALIVQVMPLVYAEDIDMRNDRTHDNDILLDGVLYVNYTFASEDCVASLDTNLPVPSVRAVDSTNTTLQLLYHPPSRAGSVVGIAIRGSAAASTSGNDVATADVTIDGTATGLQAFWSATGTTGDSSSTQAKDLDAFSAGGYIGVNITTGSDWTTNDLIVDVLTEQ